MMDENIKECCMSAECARLDYKQINHRNDTIAKDVSATVIVAVYSTS